MFQVLTGATRDFSIAPSRDGQRFLVLEATHTDQPMPITVVVNWLAELKN